MNKKNKLNNCPFCGGEAIIKQHCKNGLTIKCKSCNVKMEQRVLKFSLEWLEETMSESWNTRVAQ